MNTVVDRSAPPTQLLLALEVRGIWELQAFFASYQLLRRAPRGDGHPVLVLPGLSASDISTRPLRAYLKAQGYAVHGWKLGPNRGPRPGVEAAMDARLAEGLGLLLAAANLFFRDVKYIVEVLLTFGIFFTPMFYEAEIFGRWAPILLLNPVGAILESINAVVVLHHPPDMFWVGYIALWAIGGLFESWNIFHRAEFTFAENI